VLNNTRGLIRIVNITCAPVWTALLVRCCGTQVRKLLPMTLCVFYEIGSEIRIKLNVSELNCAPDVAKRVSRYNLFIKM